MSLSYQNANSIKAGGDWLVPLLCVLKYLLNERDIMTTIHTQGHQGVTGLS